MSTCHHCGEPCGTHAACLACAPLQGTVEREPDFDESYEPSAERWAALELARKLLARHGAGPLELSAEDPATLDRNEADWRRRLTALDDDPEERQAMRDQ